MNSHAVLPCSQAPAPLGTSTVIVSNDIDIEKASCAIVKKSLAPYQDSQVDLVIAKIIHWLILIFSVHGSCPRVRLLFHYLIWLLPLPAIAISTIFWAGTVEASTLCMNMLIAWGYQILFLSLKNPESCSRLRLPCCIPESADVSEEMSLPLGQKDWDPAPGAETQQRKLASQRLNSIYHDVFSMRAILWHYPVLCPSLPLMAYARFEGRYVAELSEVCFSMWVVQYLVLAAVCKGKIVLD